MCQHDTLTQELLRSLLTYDPANGTFTWIRSMLNHRPDLVGTLAGSEGDRGYLAVQIGGTRYFAHRLAWLYIHGFMPSMIDHINGNRSDNRIENLRIANKSTNSVNTGLSRRNTTGAKGLMRGRGKDDAFYARIVKNGKTIHIGKFPTKDEAAHAYNKAAIQLYGEFAVLNSIGADK
jgi:hypothetical protein